MHLDMPTALLFTALVAGANALAMALLAVRDRTPYLRDWAWSFALVMVGLVLAALPELLPPALSILLGSALAAAGGAGIVVGLARFTQRPVWWYGLGALLALALAAIAWYSLGVDDP